MRRTSQRLVLVALAAVAVVSCDTRLPTASRRAAPGTPPSVVIDSPVVNTQVNLGDSIFVRVQVTAGNGLKTVLFRADKLTGDKALGTFVQTPRYATVTVDLPVGVTDTTLRRYLRVLDPNDVTLDSLVLLAIATDSLGLIDTSTVRATIVSGPHVAIESPAANDSVPFGVNIAISAHATDADGIGSIQIRVTGAATWPTKLDTIVQALYDGSSRDVTFTGIVTIPPDAPGRSRFTINATATDAVRQPGSAAPISLVIQSATSINPPRVTQVVPARAERTDTVVVTVAGNQGIQAVGLVVRDSAGVLVSRDSLLLPPPLTSNVRVGIPLKLGIPQQGRHLAVTAFAVDKLGNTGYAIRPTVAGFEGSLATAFVDSTQIVYGQTYTMPLQGTVGDIAVDPGRGNIFMSNTAKNRLEVFQNATRTFSPNGIAVGSQPWGMTVAATNPDTLLVANSGGTNISRVCIGNCGASLHEDLANRILTRNVYIFVVTESRDATTGKITISVTDPVSYSDRPQYVAQSSTGRIFYSTRPTPTAGQGTIRWLDPSFPSPDPRLIWQYAGFESGTGFRYVLFNVDSVRIATAPPTSPVSDAIYIWDHPYGQKTGVICVNAPGCPLAATPSVNDAIASMAARFSDIDAQLRLDVATLGLTDTTFVATSVNRHWLAFGEGNTGGKPGRVMVTADSAGPQPQFFSPHVTVTDLTDNASERVFGLALDKTGKTVASHGAQSYFAEVDDPFHLRLQGKYDSFDDGAGIALHPDADGRNSPANQRLAFVASASGKIEIVDIAYFINRGSLQLKNPIYGPIRVSQAMAGDDPSVILKLFAITARGLVVIDLTAADIKAGPP